jgi:hypothetical protein
MISIQTDTVTRPAFGPVGSARLWAASVLLVLAGVGQAAQVTVNGPAGSGEFGRSVTILPNGNIVVTDPGFDAPGPVANVGAAYLYRPNGTLISTLRGSSANDRVGSGGIVVLANGNYVVCSPVWDNGTAIDAGAATFGSALSGVSGVVAQDNSLVGGTTGDSVARDNDLGPAVTVLSNGNYVVRSPSWDNGAIANVGAVTFGSGVGGISGLISAANSLVGSSPDDGLGRVTELSDADYVVGSPDWDNGGIVDAGAATFGSGVSGISGVVSAANSLVGSTANDFVGNNGVTALANGNYVVASRSWDHGAVVDAGAATFGSGVSGISGVVSPSNSLVGNNLNDWVGTVTALSNGNYVVKTTSWDRGLIIDAGAVTFGSGTGGTTGLISLANSLVGSTPGDMVGGDVTALSNGNYVVSSPGWNSLVPDAGAVTFGSGTSGISGSISETNSLVGGSARDEVGGFLDVTPLSNGNYVVTSPFWDDGLVENVGAVTFGSGVIGVSGVVSLANSLVGSRRDDIVGSAGVAVLANGNFVVKSSSWTNGAALNAGAATFGSGTSGIIGVVSPANSLVGSTAADFVGSGVAALSNGDYVVHSAGWNNGAVVNAGAVTFGSGVSGISGVVSLANSLVGTSPNDEVGFGVRALANGNYVMRTAVWDDGAIADVGAVTFGSGASGLSGVVSPANSLVGSTVGDAVGRSGVTALNNGNYVVISPRWDNGAVADAGAITLAIANGDVIGPITSTHSVLGTVAGQGSSQTFAYDAARNQLAVGQPASNRVVLHSTGLATAIRIVGDKPDPSIVGQPVTFTATINASPTAPTNGQVTFTASSGESCVDTTPTATSTATADFSCTMSFTAEGSSTVIAEYTGSIIHAYSGSELETHTTAVVVFANGFESP